MNSAATESDYLAPSSAILLVEDEPVLRSSLARGLSKLSNVEVLAAATVDEAVTLLGARPPSLLISDIDLPGASGLDLVAELGRRDIDVPIILVTAYLKTYRDQIPEKPNMLVLEKPVPLDDLRTRVERLLQSRGDALKPPFNLIDYVQMTCTSQGSACVDIELGDGAARVIIFDGEIWSAEDDQGSGPCAFQRLAFVPNTQLHCVALVGDPGPRNITTRWERLVLDLACPLDSAEQGESACLTMTEGSPPPGPMDSAGWPPASAAPTAISSEILVSRPARPVARTLTGIPQVDPEDLRDCDAAPSFDQHWAVAIEAVLQRRYPAAVRAFLAAGELRPGHPGVLANLRRLSEMGYAADGTGQCSN